jgi:hypothetical protein
MRVSFVLAVLFATTAIAQSTPRQLFGLWHCVSVTTQDGRDSTPRRGGLEREFRADGILIETLLSPKELGETPLRYRGRYKFRGPDRIMCTYFRGGQEYATGHSNRTYSTQLPVAGTMGKKPASQHANPSQNISNDRGGAFG